MTPPPDWLHLTSQQIAIEIAYEMEKARGLEAALAVRREKIALLESILAARAKQAEVTP